MWLCARPPSLCIADSAAQTEISACGGTASLLSLLQRLMATSDVTFNQDMRKGGKAECDEELCSTSGGTGEELLSAICHIFSALVYCEEMNESGTGMIRYGGIRWLLLGLTRLQQF